MARYCRHHVSFYCIIKICYNSWDYFIFLIKRSISSVQGLNSTLVEYLEYKPDCIPTGILVNRRMIFRLLKRRPQVQLPCHSPVVRPSNTNLDTLLIILRALLSARIFVSSHWHCVGNLPRPGVRAVHGLYSRFKGVG